MSVPPGGTMVAAFVAPPPPQHEGEAGRWSVLPEHADSAATTASGNMGGSAAAALSSGSFAGWVALGTESMNVLDAVDESPSSPGRVETGAVGSHA